MPIDSADYSETSAYVRQGFASHSVQMTFTPAKDRVLTPGSIKITGKRFYFRRHLKLAALL